MSIFNFNNDIPLGIEFGDYDSQIISSSQEWTGYYAINGKLNSSTSWCPSGSDKDKHPWIQVNLNNEKFMTSVTIQGRKDTGSGEQYVTKFRVLYSRDGKNFEHLEQFDGLTSINETVKRWFNFPILCKSIRIEILEYHIYPSIRFEFGYIPDYIIKAKLNEAKI